MSLRTVAEVGLVLLVVIVVATFAAVLFSCSPSPERAACAPEALADIELAYIAEAADVCRGHTYDDCPELPALRAKYRAKREEWAACR